MARSAETSLDFEQAKSDLRQAMRLSPHDPKSGWIFNIGGVEIEQGHYDAAIESATARLRQE